MARATTKTDLIKDANESFDKMQSLIASLTDEQHHANFNFDKDFLEKQKEGHWKRDKNIRDIFIHLYEWHQLLLNWVNSNQSGNETSFLPKPYNWKTYPKMNVGFFEKHQNTPYSHSKNMLLESHDKVINLINHFNNEELFTKKYFPWTGTTSLGSYCTSATSSHYEWAIKKLKKYIKTFK